MLDPSENNSSNYENMFKVQIIEFSCGSKEARVHNQSIKSLNCSSVHRSELCLHKLCTLRSLGTEYVMYFAQLRSVFLLPFVLLNAAHAILLEFRLNFLRNKFVQWY